jgi:hypothetical protein
LNDIGKMSYLESSVFLLDTSLRWYDGFAIFS